MRMYVDEPWSDPTALCIDHACARGRAEIRSDGFDRAVRDQHIRAFEPRAGAREHGRAANQRRRCSAGAVRGRIRVDWLGRDGHGFGLFLFSVLLRRARACGGEDGAAEKVADSVHSLLSRWRSREGAEFSTTSTLVAAADTFVLEQPALALEPAAVAGQRTVGA